MPNELPTDRLPTIEETRAMHERAVRARKKKKLQKTLATAGLVLLALALAAALALFAREKLQTLDKPLDAKTAQTQTLNRRLPPNRSRTLNRRFSPSRRRSRNPNRNRNPRRRLKKPTHLPT